MAAQCFRSNFSGLPAQTGTANQINSSNSLRRTTTFLKKPIPAVWGFQGATASAARLRRNRV